MFKALFKKQMLELNQFYFVNRKTGKRRTGFALIGNILLYIFVFGIVAFVFGMFSNQLGSIVLLMPGGDVLYYSLISIAAVLFGVIGSVFNTYAGLYRSKDNELLLSMPIRPSLILLSRMVGVYSMCLLYEGLLLLPAIVIYLIISGFSVGALICGLIVFLISAFFVLTFTCLFGWIVAIITSKLKNKNIFVTIISVLLFLLYYRFISKISTLIQKVAQAAGQIGEGIKKYAYPLYLMAKGLCGDIVSLLIFTAICVALFALTWLILSKTYIKITTKPQTIASKNTKVQSVKSSGYKSSLLKREFKHFTSCSIWMLNTGFGSLLLLLATVFVFIKSSSVDEFISVNQIPVDIISKYLPLALCCIVMLIMSIDCVTAPSISIEGKNLWIVQSLPIPAKDVLFAKLKMHIIINLPVSVLFIIAVAFAFKMSILLTVLCMVCICCYVLLSGAFGLVINLNNYNLTWTNIMVPVKQGLPVFLSIFGGMGYVAILGVGCFFGLRSVNIELCISAVALINLMISAILIKYIAGKGAKKFEKIN